MLLNVIGLAAIAIKLKNEIRYKQSRLLDVWLPTGTNVAVIADL